MSADKLSKRYALSLFEEVKQTQQLEAVNIDMISIGKMISGSKEFKLFLKSPVIHAAKKVDVLSALLKDKVSPLVYRLVLLLVEKGREGYLDEIADAFNKMFNQYRNITVATVTTAIDLDNDSRAQIEQVIISKVGKTQLEIISKVDPSIMGGFIIDLGDKVYNASVKHRLASIANELTKH